MPLGHAHRYEGAPVAGILLHGSPKLLACFGDREEPVWTRRPGSEFVPEETAVPVTEEARAEQGLGPRPTA